MLTFGAAVSIADRLRTKTVKTGKAFLAAAARGGRGRRQSLNRTGSRPVDGANYVTTTRSSPRLWLRPAARLVIPTTVTNGAVTMGAALGGVIVARALGPDGRGIVAAIMAWFVAVQVLAEGGVQGATAFYAARVRTNRRRLISTSSRMLTVQASVIGAVALALVWALDLPREFSWGFTAVVGGLVPVLWLSASLFSLQGIRIPLWNTARATQVPVYVGLLAALWWANRLTPVSASVAVTVSNLFAGVVAFLLCRSLLSRMSTADDVVSVRRIYRYALPNLAWTLPGIVSSRLDVMSLSLLATAGELGQYAVAVALTSLSVPIVSSIGNVLMPLLSRRSSEGLSTGAVEGVAVMGAAGVATAVTLVSALAAPWIVPVFFGPGFADVPCLTWLLIPATVLYGTNWVAAEILRGVGNPGAAARAEWTGLIINAIAVPAGVIMAGAAGAALAQTLGFSAALLTMLRTLRSRRKDAVEPPPAETETPA
jgi:O-antigen/teichoic acid export membrane protein